MEVSMKIASKLLLGLALLQGAAYAADAPLTYTTRGGRAGMARTPR